MKKLLSILLCLLLCPTFSGCALREAVDSEAIEYLVSAVGFDEGADGIELYFEAVIVNSEDTSADKKVKLIEGKGKNVTEAVSDAAQKTVHPFMLSHLAVAVIGSSISAERFEEICDYCYSEDEITLAMLFVAARNAKELLSCETVSSIAVGYDIMSMLEQQGERTGTEYKNRFYEVESAKEKPLNIITLPFFEVEEQSFLNNGLLIYKNNAPALRLDEEQTFFYSLATDTLGAGRVVLDGRQYTVNSAYSKVDFAETEEITAEMTLKLKTKGNSIDRQTIKDGIYRLFELSKEKETDILGLGNIMYSRKKQLWDTVKQDYGENYKNFSLTVEFEE